MTDWASLQHHASWSKPCCSIWEATEDPRRYRIGGYHFVRLGDAFKDARYKIIHKLGAGAYATVWLARDILAQRFVTLKILRADVSPDCTELKILKFLWRLQQQSQHQSQHHLRPPPSLCTLLLDTFEITGDHGTHICLVLPLAGRPLTDFIMDFNINKQQSSSVIVAQRYGLELAQAVAYLHSVGIVHGDLTSSNILVQLDPVRFHSYSLDELYQVIGYPIRVCPSSWSESSRSSQYLVEPADLSKLPYGKALPDILLIDFGTAFFIDNPPAHGPGTPLPYCPPEGLLFKESSVASDLWSLGCLLFEFWAHRQLWDNQGFDMGVYQWALTLGKPPWQYWENWTGRDKFFYKNGRYKILDYPSQAREYSLRSEIMKISESRRMPNTPPKSPKRIITYVEDNALVQRECSPKTYLRSPKALEPKPAFSNETDENLPPGADEMARMDHDFVVSQSKISGGLPLELQYFEDLLSQILKYCPNERLPAWHISRHVWLNPTHIAPPSSSYYESISSPSARVTTSLYRPVFVDGSWDYISFVV